MFPTPPELVVALALVAADGKAPPDDAGVRHYTRRLYEAFHTASARIWWRDDAGTARSVKYMLDGIKDAPPALPAERLPSWESIPKAREEARSEYLRLLKVGKGEEVPRARAVLGYVRDLLFAVAASGRGDPAVGYRPAIARRHLKKVRDYLGKEAYEKAVRTGVWPHVNDRPTDKEKK